MLKRKCRSIPAINSPATTPPPAPSRTPGRACFPSPTVLEAINCVLTQRGLPTLWVQPDGTIGPTDPLLLRVEYVPTPFVL
jgi:hypothetical protein